MTSFREQAGWAKMTSIGGKLTALASHLTKYVNKAEKPTYLSTNLGTSLDKLTSVSCSWVELVLMSHHVCDFKIFLIFSNGTAHF
jgi:hypothetical protein